MSESMIEESPSKLRPEYSTLRHDPWRWKEYVALLGLVLQIAYPILWVSLVMYFVVILSGGSAVNVEDSWISNDQLVSKLFSVYIVTFTCHLLGLGLTLISLFVLHVRRRWFYVSLIISSVSWLLCSPFHIMLAIFIAIVLRQRRNEFE